LFPRQEDNSYGGVEVQKYRRNIKVKVKLSLGFFLTEHHAMKAYSGNGGTAPRIL
jgi:hypothetical protein